MTAIEPYLSPRELEFRYKAAAEPVAKSHFHAIWLLSSGLGVKQVAELLSFSPRWIRLLIKRYNEGGPDQLGDRRVNNGTEARILTPEALAGLKERLRTPPDGGGLWTGPKVARWMAWFHGLKSVHDQRGWDALMAIGWSIQQPRPRHPAAADDAERARLKKTSAGACPRKTRASRRRSRGLGDGRAPHRA